MQVTGNTILITGGGTGIGRGLAREFHARGNTVIIAGRRKAVVEKTAAEFPGMVAMTVDVEDAASINDLARRVVTEHPDLNVVLNNAGMMWSEDLRGGPTEAVAAAEATVTVNLLGTIRLTGALLPHLLTKPRAAIMTVSSGLAFVPRSSAPTYCATKAAIHSWSQSLRHQLRDTGVEVIELVPPYVQTELTGAAQAADPRAMPLEDYITETMRLLAASPTPQEVLVERVKLQRFAEARGEYDSFYKTFNDMLVAAAAQRTKP